MPVGAALELYRRRRIDPHALFSDAEIARAAAYHRPLRRVSRAESILLAAGVLVALGAHAGRHLLAALGLAGWAWQTLAVASGLVLAGTVLDLPFGRWRLAYERRWGFARQSTAAWLRDRALELAISLVLLDGLALGFVALARATPLWWLLTWLGVSLLSVLMVMVAPAVLSPLFNRFRPLEDAELVDATVALGRRVGVAIRQVLVMDASRRTAKHNAYFTGLGRTKRVVLWDTLLADYGRPATLAVLAHELGHWRRRHLPTMLAVTSAVTLPGLLALDAVLRAPAVQRWAGVSGPADPAGLLLAVAGVGLLQAAWLPVAAWLSRAWERQADRDALDLTGDPAAFVAMQRDLAVRNLSDVAPSRLAYLLASHPPAPERMGLAHARPALSAPGSGAGVGR